VTGNGLQDRGSSVNKALLPILARLHSLQTPADIDPAGGRLIAAGTHPSPITALMREINETMLGRSLTFQSDAGPRMTLEVAGRRVLRMAAAEGLARPETCLSAPALEDAQKDELIRLLQALAIPGRALRVVSTPISNEAEGVSVGLPVALLADLMLVELNGIGDETPPPTPEMTEEPAANSRAPVVEPATGDSLLGRFARANGQVLMAWMIAGGAEDGASDGPEEMVSHLLGFLDADGEAVSQQLDQISTTPGGPVCIALGANLAMGNGILCARADDGFLLALIDGDSTQTMLRAWVAALA
jgi:hypothetical protein